MQISEIKSQISSMKAEQITKMNDIVQMQGVIRSDLMDIRTNMQFLSESVSAMISSSMDEIMRMFRDKTSVHGVGDAEAHGVGGSDKPDEVVT